LEKPVASDCHDIAEASGLGLLREVRRATGTEGNSELRVDIEKYHQACSVSCVRKQGLHIRWSKKNKAKHATASFMLLDETVV